MKRVILQIHYLGLSLLALACLGMLSQSVYAETVESPDASLQLDVWLQDGEPRYQVRRFGEPVILASRLGFLLATGRPLSGNFEVEALDLASEDKTWTQVWGEQRQIRCHYNELRMTLRQQDDLERKMVLVFRVFDDGVGFRYEFPEQPNIGEVQIAEELTEFAFAADAQCWWIPAYQDLRYEYLYTQSQIDEVRKVHTPFTCETADGLCISIHEAALYNFASMTLKNVGERTLQADLVPWSDGIKVRTAAPFHTPWRTIQIGDNASELVTSYLTLNLNEPNKLEDTSWIETGKYVGVWWEMHLNTATWGSGERHGANTDHVKRYIDFASKYGFRGVLVEGWNEGWDGDWYSNGDVFSFTKPYNDFDLTGLADYARERGVFLVGHHETSGGIDNYEAQMQDAYQLYERLGVRAVKSGYVANGRNVVRKVGNKTTREWHHGQYMVEHYQRALEAAAKHHTMLVAHEPIKDTGIRRTWPNMMSREGARGQEYNAWAADGGNPPEHTVILPFTRMLSGPMDFTPGVFDLLLTKGDRPDNRVNTTLAKQLALYVVLYAPLQMAVDLPEVYEEHLDAFQFIRDVATDWEQTQVLHAKIGDYFVVARQKRDSEEWFLGAATDEYGRTLETPLSFLDSETLYLAQIYADAEDADWKTNPTAYAISEQQVTSNTKLNLRLAPGGGQAIRFVPLESASGEASVSISRKP